jgi:hypothetical protein
MKKNYFTVIAVAGLLLLGTVAQAADIEFSGQFRPRMNFDSDGSDLTTNTQIFDTRVRLNAKSKINANTSIFLQFQSVGSWGVADLDTDANDGTRISVGGGNDQASDVLADVGFHQAFVTYKKLAGANIDGKIGRQEVVIGGHRLFGHTGWLQGGETKDAIRLTHSAGNHTVGYTFIAGQNQDGIANSTEGNEHVHVITASTQGIMGGALEGIFTWTDDDNTGTNWEDQMSWMTIGARQKGKAGGLDYRVEYYHQFGDAGSIANAAAMGIQGANADGDSADRDAHMFGVRVGKTFKNIKYSPSVTFWYDNLSGVDDDDADGGEWGAFDVMYDTGHKFYGFMDVFLNRTGLNTGYYGLQDIALKTKMTPAPGWTLKADIHHFRTQTDISGSDADTVIASDASLGGAMDEDLGTELDVTLVHKYDANTKIVFGISHYFTTTTFSQLNTGAGSLANAGGSNQNDGADWGYIMIDTKF